MGNISDSRRRRLLLHKRPWQIARIHDLAQSQPMRRRNLLVRMALFVRRELSALLSYLTIALFKSPHRRRVNQNHLEDRRNRTALQKVDPVEEMENRFLAMASHELKTPMTTIFGQSQLLQRRLSKLPELSSDIAIIRTTLEMIDIQTRRLNAIVNDLLVLDSIRSGQVELRRGRCDLGDLCREVVEEQQLVTDRVITLELPPKAVYMFADGDRLCQVIMNLVDNALKYSPAGTPVQIRISQRYMVGIIQVRDAGPGIPKSQQAHLFEPFYRAPEVRSSSKSGLGLGLTICKELVERHGGRIWCDSYVDVGSSFFVELPLYAEN